jgi:hypothetical protein
MGVKNAGYKGQTSIGFTTDSFKMRRQPGWGPLPCCSVFLISLIWVSSFVVYYGSLACRFFIIASYL